ncbi:MAG: ATPase [Alphaproteobacteria bacterium]|nr:ATPase [Alphaproteobacteria bacterium]
MDPVLGKSIKRFYKQAAAVAGEGGFVIHLDGKPVKTPLGHRLALPSLALAEAVAAEWQAQGTEIKPHSMPLTQLSSTAIDRVGPERGAITAQLMAYAGTDLLCYRADFPPELVKRQAASWQPLVDWARTALGAELTVTEGVIAIAQAPAALTALQAHLDGLDVWVLTAAQSACAATGSLVLALALAAGRVDTEAAFAVSQLDEDFQIEQWGEDYEAADRRTALRADLRAAERLLNLCRAA